MRYYYVLKSFTLIIASKVKKAFQANLGPVLLIILGKVISKNTSLGLFDFKHNYDNYLYLNYSLKVCCVHSVF